MYEVDRTNNEIIPIQEVTFTEKKLKERQHLQERIAKKPDVFGEELLIIQKEFSGWENSNKRLDLLALDGNWNLVIIENKLDDSWTDLVWQVLNYTAFCSTMTVEHIIQKFQSYLNTTWWWKAEDRLEEFYSESQKWYEQILADASGEWNQRMFLVAREYRIEVTSSVLRLRERWIDIVCFKSNLYEHGSKILFDLDMIIPIQDAKDYLWRVADKKVEEKVIKKQWSDIDVQRYAYWKQFLETTKDTLPEFQTLEPTIYWWLWLTVVGIKWCGYTIIIKKNECFVELATGEKPKWDVTTDFYEYMLSHKDQIEKQFWEPLLWYNENWESWGKWNSRTRIRYTVKWLSPYDEQERQESINTLAKKMRKLIDATGTIVSEYRI